MNLIKRLFKEENGQGLIEYVLIVGLIALIAVGAIGLAGTSISGIWDTVKNKLGDVKKDVDAAVTPGP